MAIKKVNENFVYTFPAIRGIQAGLEYYTTMVPIASLEVLFRFDEEDVPVELRHQRELKEVLAKKIVEYILKNKTSYTLPALTASIDYNNCEFQPIEGYSKLGNLIIPVGIKIYLNDGQHRRYALIQCLKEWNDLQWETIAVTFYLDTDLQRIQQRFTDINSTASRPTSSITKVFDNRDEKVKQIKFIMGQSFNSTKVEKEKTSVSGKSRKLFAFNALYKAIDESLRGIKAESLELQTQLAIAYWQAVNKAMAYLWNEVDPKELRAEYLCTHGVILTALGMIGADLLIAKKDKPEELEKALDNLSKANWERSNSIWIDRAINFRGEIVATQTASRMAAIYLKQILGLKLDSQEQKLEAEWKERNAKN